MPRFGSMKLGESQTSHADQESIMRLMVVCLAMFVATDSLRADDEDDRLARQLVRVVQDPLAKEASRIEAAVTLGKLGPKASAAVDGLAAQLKVFKNLENEDLHAAILQALGDIGPAAKPAIPVIVRSTGRNIDLDRSVKRSINLILYGPERLDVTQLVGRLVDRNPAVRIQAIKGLGELGPVAVAAAPALMNLLSDPDRDVREAAFNALKLINPVMTPNEAIYKFFALDLASGDAGVRLRAAKTLGDFGPKASSAIPALQQALTDPDKDVRRAAFEALGKISPP